MASVNESIFSGGLKKKMPRISESIPFATPMEKGHQDEVESQLMSSVDLRGGQKGAVTLMSNDEYYVH